MTTRYLYCLCFWAMGLFLCAPATTWATQHPNVLLIVCDDLNDYVDGFGGHPQARTPNILRLAQSGVAFSHAHCNIPICGPSRASLFTGIYPHHSGCYGFERWDHYEVLRSSRTIMDHFRANGYRTLGTGKLMHHLSRREWMSYGNPADYGPFPFDGTNRIAHPDVPSPFRDIGPIDGSFGPLVSLHARKSPDGKPMSWQTGGWQNVRPMRVESQDDRDPTPDERNSAWAVEKLKELAAEKNGTPFFMAVGFIRPHTPLIVPKRFFDKFPIDSIKLPVIKPGDVQDTFARTVRGSPEDKEPGSNRTNDMGTRLYTNLVASYPTPDTALRHFIQAYLASVASVDELIGEILDAVDRSSLRNNTVIVLTSDHGWGMGEKDYLYKNSLWEESTRIPLIIRAPGVGKPGAKVDVPVSLIDIYPTLIDLCGLTRDTVKTARGHALDGFSMKPLLEDPSAASWNGPDAVLTALYRWEKVYDPADQSYALRSRDWRYIRYRNGREELYHDSVDPYEWRNLAGDAAYGDQLRRFREQLAARLPKPGVIPPQPGQAPAGRAAATSGDEKAQAEAWKNRYFAQHPDADVNHDGKLTWYELRQHRKRK